MIIAIELKAAQSEQLKAIVLRCGFLPEELAQAAVAIDTLRTSAHPATHSHDLR
jgi:hypothetical protein